MGPINVALVKLFQADQQLREAKSRLDTATKGVRLQERRVGDIAEKLKLSKSKLMEQQSKSAQHELDLKSRDAQIEKLRNQQQHAKNNKEYQTFLIEINTQKVDKAKIEEEMLKVMQIVENDQTEVQELSTSLETEQGKLKAMRDQINDRIAAMQAEIDALRPADQAAAAVSPQARETFERLADRFDGEAMSALGKPDRRREEYSCTACSMDLVTDVYNKLHARDEIVFCPSCRRILYIPDDLPPELAVKKPRERKDSKPYEYGAAVGRQSNAEDILNSVTVEPEEPAATSDAPGNEEPATSNAHESGESSPQ